MQLQSARELKDRLLLTVLAPLTKPVVAARSLALAAGPHPSTSGHVRTIALGITPAGPGDFRLAVRYQRRELEDGHELEQIRKKAKNEVDVRYIGRVAKLAKLPDWQQRRHRPLQVGTSIGHPRVTA